MKIPAREMWQLVGARLGFGSLAQASPVADPEPEVSDIAAEPEPPPPVSLLSEDPAWLAEKSVNPLAALAAELEREAREPEVQAEPEPESAAKSGGEIKADSAALPDVGILLAQLSQNISQQKSEPVVVRNSGQVRIHAFGFPLTQRARLSKMVPGQLPGAALEFVTHEEIRQGASDSSAAEFWILNVASVSVVQKMRAEFRALIDSGKPVLLTGARSAVKLLGIYEAAEGQSRVDFLPSPWDPAELTWRLQRLLQEPAAQRAERRSAAAPVFADAAPHSQQQKLAQIAIADHDPVTRALMESALSIPGSMHVQAVADGAALLEQLRANRPQVAVFDLMLPNRDGFQILAELKRDADLRQVRVVILSARQTEADVLRAFALGADDYVPKPFSPLELRARVRRLIEPC